MGESILLFFRISLSKFSLEALLHLWVKGVFILEWERNVKRQDLQNRGGSRLDLAAWLSHKIQSRDNCMASCPVLSCSAPASMTGHLPACLARVLRLAAWSRESPARPSRESLFYCTLLSKLHSISLTTLTRNPPKYRVTKCWNTCKFGTDVLNGLIQELWAQANSWRPIEHDPCGQQKIITLIQVLEGSCQG